MDVLNSALSILIDVTQNKQTFHDANKKFFADETNQNVSKADVNAFVGCCLRHFYVFRAVANRFIYEASDKAKLAIGIAIANAAFLKRVEDKVAIDFVSSIFEGEEVKFVLDDFVKLYNAKKAGEPLIDPKIEKGSLKYMNQRFNIPEWLAKMWANNFSGSVSYRICRAMSKSPIQYVRYLPSCGKTKEELLHKYNTLSAVDFDEDMFCYTGKETLRRQKFISGNETFQMPVGLKQMIDKLPIESFKNCVVYSYNYNVLPIELGVKYKNELKVQHLVEPGKDLFIFKNAITRYRIKGVLTIECTPSQFVTAISHKVACFILMPNSSNFDRLRFDPDYFLQFNRDSLDELILKQNQALNEAAPFIEDGGYIVYTVPTINKKETTSLIRNFLSEHQDFELAFEKQYFPYEEGNSTIYYAIIRKKVENGQN